MHKLSQQCDVGRSVDSLGLHSEQRSPQRAPSETSPPPAASSSAPPPPHSLGLLINNFKIKRFTCDLRNTGSIRPIDLCLLWNQLLTDRILQRLKRDLLCLRLQERETRHQTDRWAHRQAVRQEDRQTDRYLLCIRIVLRVHVHLQRDDVSDALPLRQTIFI